MPVSVLGLHHVTATADDAQADLDFCTGALGLRLVKKTVNFDNHHVYHFYYGTERGAPGTIWTTFPYKGQGVRVGTKGAGQVVVTSFSVPQAALGAWRDRLRALGADLEDGETRFEEETLRVRDRSGLQFELVANAEDTRLPWLTAGLDPESAIRGLHSVTMVVRTPEQTIDFMSAALGWRIVDETAGRIRMGTGEAGPGRTIDIVPDREAPAAVNGLGTVHHVAMAVAEPADQLRLREELAARGLQVTPVRDRCYFQSIYFREPGGVLFEVATVQPGFLVDEPLEDLGRSLKLPPWEEPSRPSIEAVLPPVRPHPS